MTVDRGIPITEGAILKMVAEIPFAVLKNMNTAVATGLTVLVVRKNIHIVTVITRVVVILLNVDLPHTIIQAAAFTALKI